MVTTEISQVPLSGVRELLKSAKSVTHIIHLSCLVVWWKESSHYVRRAGVLSVLDLDIPPSVRPVELAGVALCVCVYCCV